jgi:hypothetical protein
MENRPCDVIGALVVLCHPLAEEIAAMGLCNGPQHAEVSLEQGRRAGPAP